MTTELAVRSTQIIEMPEPTVADIVPFDDPMIIDGEFSVIDPIRLPPEEMIEYWPENDSKFTPDPGRKPVKSEPYFDHPYQKPWAGHTSWVDMSVLPISKPEPMPLPVPQEQAYSEPQRCTETSPSGPSILDDIINAVMGFVDNIVNSFQGISDRIGSFDFVDSGSDGNAPVHRKAPRLMMVSPAYLGETILTYLTAAGVPFVIEKLALADDEMPEYAWSVSAKQIKWCLATIRDAGFLVERDRERDLYVVNRKGE